MTTRAGALTASREVRVEESEHAPAGLMSMPTLRLPGRSTAWPVVLHGLVCEQPASGRVFGRFTVLAVDPAWCSAVVYD